MPKLRNRGRASQEQAPPRGIDEAVGDLKELADSDVGARRDRIPRTKGEAEEDALPAQRAAYERVVGKKITARKNLSQADERGRLDDESDRDDELDEDDEQISGRKALDVNEDGNEPEADEDVDDEEDTTRVPKRVQRALDALRRARVPKAVYDKLEDEDLVQLADSYASAQSNADRVLGSKDETIRTLTAALAAGGKRTSAGGESPETETPSEDDLNRAAEGLARSMGVEADEKTTKALIEFGRATRKGVTNSAEKAELQRLRGVVADMLLDQGTQVVRKSYSEHLSDPDAQQRLRKRMIALDSEGGFGNDVGRLAKEAARSLWGDPPRRAKDERARARRGSAPVTQTRETRRAETKAPSEGTEEHDRAVYRRVMRKDRSRLATRR